jgi:hypothetical protein
VSQIDRLARIKTGTAAYGPDPASEWEPSYTLDRNIAEARREMGEERWAELVAEWDEFPARVVK